MIGFKWAAHYRGKQTNAFDKLKTKLPPCLVPLPHLEQRCYSFCFFAINTRSLYEVLVRI